MSLVTYSFNSYTVPASTSVNATYSTTTANSYQPGGGWSSTEEANSFRSEEGQATGINTTHQSWKASTIGSYAVFQAGYNAMFSSNYTSSLTQIALASIDTYFSSNSVSYDSYAIGSFSATENPSGTSGWTVTSTSQSETFNAATYLTSINPFGFLAGVFPHDTAVGYFTTYLTSGTNFSSSSLRQQLLSDVIPYSSVSYNSSSSGFTSMIYSLWGRDTAFGTYQFSVLYSATTSTWSQTSSEAYYTIEIYSYSVFTFPDYTCDPPDYTYCYTSVGSFLMPTSTATVATNVTGSSSSSGSTSTSDSAYLTPTYDTFFTTATFHRSYRAERSTSTAVNIYTFGGTVATTTSTVQLTISNDDYTYLTTTQVIHTRTDIFETAHGTRVAGDWFLPGSRATTIRGTSFSVDANNISNDWLFSIASTTGTNTAIQDWISSTLSYAQNAFPISTTITIPSAIVGSGAGFNYTFHDSTSPVNGTTTTFTVATTTFSLATSTVFTAYNTIPFPSSSSFTASYNSYYSTLKSQAIVISTLSTHTRSFDISAWTGGLPNTMLPGAVVFYDGFFGLPFGLMCPSTMTTTAAVTYITTSVYSQITIIFTAYSNSAHVSGGGANLAITALDTGTISTSSTKSFTIQTPYPAVLDTDSPGYYSTGLHSTITATLYAYNAGINTNLFQFDALAFNSLTITAHESLQGFRSDTFGSGAAYSQLAASPSYISTVWQETSTSVSTTLKTTNTAGFTSVATTRQSTSMVSFSMPTITTVNNPFFYGSFPFGELANISGVIPASYSYNTNITRTSAGVGYIAYISYTGGISSSTSSVINQSYQFSATGSGNTVFITTTGNATFNTFDVGSTRSYSMDQRTYSWTDLSWGASTASPTVLTLTAHKNLPVTTSNSFSFTWTLNGSTSGSSLHPTALSGYEFNVSGGTYPIEIVWGQVGPLGEVENVYYASNLAGNFTYIDATGGSTTANSLYRQSNYFSLSAGISVIFEPNTHAETGGASPFPSNLGDAGQSWVKYPDYKLTSD